MKKNKEGFEDLIKKYSDSPFAMQSLDAQGRFLFVNRAWSKTTGYCLKDVKGKLFSYIFDEEGKKLFKKNFTQFKKKKQAKNIVFNLVKKNGQIISAVFEGRFFCDKSGKLMFTECLLKDISKYIDDSKTSLAHKFQSENKFKKLYDSMEEGVAMHEIVYNKAGKATNYRILDVNLAFQKILGIKKEQVVGKIATKAYNVNRPPYFDVYLKTAQTGKPTKIEAYFEPFKKHFRILVVSIEKNKFTTIFEDVTDKHIAHKQIEEAKNKFKFLLHNSAQIILIINRAGKIQFANNTLFEQLGYRSEDVVGKLFTKFLTKSSALAGMKSLALEMSGKPQPALTIDVFAKDGSIRKLKTSENTKWYEENGKKVGLIISAVDITEEALAKEELAKNEKKYRALIENSQAIIFMIDREGKFILSEGGGLNVLGLKPGQVVGQSVYKIYKDYPKIINGVKEALSGKVVRGEIKVGQIFFDIMYTPFEGPKGGGTGNIRHGC